MKVTAWKSEDLTLMVDELVGEGKVISLRPKKHKCICGYETFGHAVLSLLKIFFVPLLLN